MCLALKLTVVLHGYRPRQQITCFLSSLLYALRVLRSHGLPGQSLKDVLHATVTGKLMYCAPAWHGLCTASDYARLDSFLRRCVKLGYAGQLATVIDMCSEADDALFRRVLYNKKASIR